MSAVVVLLPADPSAVAHPDGDAPDELHVTMCYLGDDLDPVAIADVKEVLAPLATATPPIDAAIAGAGILGKDAAVVLFLQDDRLIDLQETIEQVLATLGLSNPDRFPGFIPHLTVGYPHDDIERGEALLHHALPLAGQWVRLDKLAIMNGDDLHVVAMGPDAMTDPMLMEGADAETDPFDEGAAIVAAPGVVQVEAAGPASDERQDTPGEPAPTIDAPAVDATPLAGTGHTHAGLIIKAADTGRVLMTQRTPYHQDDAETSGAWEFPGGGLDPGEDALEGALREFVEETGLRLPVYEVRDECSNEIYRGFVVVVPNESWTADVALDPMETMGIGWFNVEDVPQLARPEVGETMDADKILQAAVPRVAAWRLLPLPDGLDPGDVVAGFAEAPMIPAAPAPGAAPAAPGAPAMPPAKPPIVLVGLSVSNPETVPHGGRGLPYMSDAPYVALGEIRLRKNETPEMVAMVVDSLAPIPAKATVKSSLTRSNPLSRAVLMDPPGLVQAYEALRTAFEASGLKWEDYPFAVQVGDQVPVGDVKALTGNTIEFGSLIAVMPDGTVLNTQGSQPGSTAEEDTMDTTPTQSMAQRLRDAAAQRTARLTVQSSAVTSWRVHAAQRAQMASEFPPIAEDADDAPSDDADMEGGAKGDVYLVGADGAEFGPIASFTGDMAAVEGALGDVMVTIGEDPSAVDVSGLTAALDGAGAESEVHDDMSGGDIPPGSYSVMVKAADSGSEDMGGDAQNAPAPPAFAAAPSVTDIGKTGRYARWEGPLVVEGIPSGDSRTIDAGALTWRNLPLPLMMMTKNPVGGDGHDGAELAGRIDRIERRDNNEIWGFGILDLGSDAGREAERLLTPDEFGHAMLRGVSVDLDDVEMYFEGGDTFDGQGQPVMSVAKARIMGATLCPFPAFQEAQVVLVSDALAAALGGEACDCDNEQVLVASAGLAQHGCQVRTFLPIPWEAPSLVASGGAVPPVKPPLAWFNCPPVDQIPDESVRVHIDGRIAGLAADSKTCHIGFADRCVQTPKSRSNYSYFANKQVETAEGVLVATGTIIMDTVHPNLRLRASDAQAFYAHTGCAVADVKAYDTPKGMYIAGALRPTATPEQIRALRGSDISPDWRSIGGSLECVALLAVNTSGFITPALAASGAQQDEAVENFVKPGNVASHVSFETNEVYALVAAGMRRHSERQTISATNEVERLAAEFAEFKALVGPLVDDALAARRAAATQAWHARRANRRDEAMRRWATITDA